MGQGSFDKHMDDGLEELYMMQMRDETLETGTVTVKKTVRKGLSSHTETERESRKAVKWPSVGKDKKAHEKKRKSPSHSWLE